MFGAYVAEVVTVSLTANGYKVDKVVAVVDCRARDQPQRRRSANQRRHHGRPERRHAPGHPHRRRPHAREQL
ncbi:hypothetical protein LP420_10290 [Massilia sp. B-10]|nr:hypothetical protein LP420_10290 [Massilia sp. B-10]